MFSGYGLAVVIIAILGHMLVKEYSSSNLERYARINERIEKQSHYNEIMTEEQCIRFSSAIRGVYKEIHYAMKNENYKLADYYVAVIDEVAQEIMNG